MIAKQDLQTTRPRRPMGPSLSQGHMNQRKENGRPEEGGVSRGRGRRSSTGSSISSLSAEEVQAKIGNRQIKVVPRETSKMKIRKRNRPHFNAALNHFRDLFFMLQATHGRRIFCSWKAFPQKVFQVKNLLIFMVAINE